LEETPENLPVPAVIPLPDEAEPPPKPVAKARRARGPAVQGTRTSLLVVEEAVPVPAEPRDSEWADGVSMPITPKPRLPRPAASEDAAAAPAEAVVGEVIRRLELASGELQPHALRSHDVAFETIRCQPASDRRLEETWQGQTRDSWKWWASGGVATLALVAASVASVLALNAGRRSSAPPFALDGIEREKVELDERFAFFQEDPIPLQGEAIGLLRQYVSAHAPDEALAAVRSPEIVGERLHAVWLPWPSPPVLDRPESIQFAYTDSVKPPFLLVFGKRADETPFRAYFVREGSRLRLDWEATEGICDIPIAALPTAGEVRDLTVRCVLEARAFHTNAFPDTHYRSYSLNTADRQAWVWGYVERDGVTDRRLQETLDTDSSILVHKNQERVTLRISASPGRDLPNQFLITEMLHIDWVRP
jgi:hypothetical protein